MRIGLGAIALLGLLPAAFAAIEGQPQPTAPAAAHDCHHDKPEGQAPDLLHQQQPRQKRAADAPKPTSSSTTVVVSSSSSSTATTAAITEIAVFSAEGITYTVTSVDGVEKVDGVTLSTAAIDIGGIEVAEATGKKAAIVAGGKTIKFKTETMLSSSSSSSAAPVSISPSASSVAPSSSSSSSSNAAAATPGMGRGGKVVGLACGAVVAGWVL